MNTCAVKEPIHVNRNTIEAVDKYIDLGKNITTGDIDVEISKRIGKGWNDLEKWIPILKQKKTSPKV